jgi:peptidase M50B-like protein
VAADVAAALTLPVVAGTAVAVLVLLAVATEAVNAPVTVAHEGGHMAMGALTGYRVFGFELENGFNGGTQRSDTGWALGRILTVSAGYTAPPLLGLGGAALLAAGEASLLLWTAVVLLVLAWVKARGELTLSVVLLLAFFIAYVALYGTPTLQAAFAAGLVWLLLIGGVYSAWTASTDDDTDPAKLAHDTLIPRKVWWAAFVAFALFCLWQAILLLAP